MRPGQKLWTRDELLLAVELYCRLPFGQMDQRNKEVIELAHLIGRTPGAVAYKLVNFASLDRSLKERGIKGADHASKLDKEVWDEFYNDSEALISESLYVKAKASEIDILELIEGQRKIGEDRETIVRQRVNQDFFRKALLASYEGKCSITGIAIKDFLIAAHIIPWSQDVVNRLNPSNGILLNALHDKAFEKGYIAINSNYEVEVSSNISELGEKQLIETYFMQFHKKRIHLPKKFLPDTNLLERHYHERFQK